MMAAGSSISHRSWLIVVFLGYLNFELGHRSLSQTKNSNQVFLCIFQKISAMATLGLKEMGKFLREDREKCLPCCFSQFSKTELRQPTRQNLFLPSQRNFPISFKPKVAIAKFIWKMQKKVWHYEKRVGRHASFPPRRSVKFCAIQVLT